MLAWTLHAARPGLVFFSTFENEGRPFSLSPSISCDAAHMRPLPRWCDSQWWALKVSLPTYVPLKFGFSWLHATQVLQTNYGIVFLKGKIKYLSISFYQSLERGREDHHQFKTNSSSNNKPTNSQPIRQQTPPSGTCGSLCLGVVQMCWWKLSWS